MYHSKSKPDDSDDSVGKYLFLFLSHEFKLFTAHLQLNYKNLKRTPDRIFKDHNYLINFEENAWQAVNGHVKCDSMLLVGYYFSNNNLV